MKAEVVFRESRGYEVPTFAVEINAETDQDRVLLAGMDNNPFHAVVVRKSKGSVLRVYAIEKGYSCF